MAATFQIAILLTSLAGRSLDVFDWPKYEFTNMLDCKATLSEPATLQTLARLGAEFAFTTGAANFAHGYCYENRVPLDPNGNETRKP